MYKDVQPRIAIGNIIQAVTSKSVTATGDPNIGAIASTPPSSKTVDDTI